MIFWHFGKDAREERRDQFGNEINRTCFFANRQNAQPQRHHAREWQRDFHHGDARRIERAVDDAFEDFAIAQKYPLRQRSDKTNDKKSGPEIGECHGAMIGGLSGRTPSHGSTFSLLPRHR